MEHLKRAALLYCERNGLDPLKYERGEKTFFEHGGREWLFTNDGDAFRLFALYDGGDAPEKAEFADMLARVCAGIADQMGHAAGCAVLDCILNVGVTCGALSAAWHEGSQILLRVETFGVIGGE